MTIMLFAMAAMGIPRHDYRVMLYNDVMKGFAQDEHYEIWWILLVSKLNLEQQCSDDTRKVRGGDKALRTKPGPAAH